MSRVLLLLPNSTMLQSLRLTGKLIFTDWNFHSLLSRKSNRLFRRRYNESRQASSETKNAYHETGITAYNSSQRVKSPILTKNPKLVTWYMCGPTVYDHSHIGHAWYLSQML